MEMIGFENLLVRFHKQAPVDLRALGLEVNKATDMDNDFSAMIKREEEGSYKIIVNANHSWTRQRFSVAHEIAHYILHRDEIDIESIKDNGLYRSDILENKEVEANKLAAKILMPRLLIYRIIREKYDNRLSEEVLKSLAKDLEVSENALRVHLNIPVIERSC